jgi:hypothetical protein
LQTDNYKSIQSLISKYESIIQSDKANQSLVKVQISNEKTRFINESFSENSKQIKILFDLLYLFRSQAKIFGKIFKEDKQSITYKVNYVYSNSINLYLLINVNNENEIKLTKIDGYISFDEKIQCLKSSIE